MGSYLFFANMKGIDIGRYGDGVHCAYDRAIGCQAMGDWFLFPEGEEKWIVAGCLVDWRKLGQDRWVCIITLDIVIPIRAEFLTRTYLCIYISVPTS